MGLSRLAWIAVPVVVATACGSAVLGGGSSPAPSASGSAAAPSATHSQGHTPSAAGATTRTVVAADETAADGTRQVDIPLPGGPYSPAAPSGGTDDYHCFLLDPGITADTFLTSMAFLPGNPDVVHHAIMFRVPPDRVADVEAHDAATEGAGWTCFGDAGIPKAGDAMERLNDAPWLAAWAPGGPDTTFAKGTGVAMPAGTRVIVQVHYNLLAGGGADTSGLRMRLAKPGTRLEALETLLMPAPVELPCPAGTTGRLCDRDSAVADLATRFGPDSIETVGRLQLLCDGDAVNPHRGDTQVCLRSVKEPMTVVSAAGHMHLLGKSITIDRIARDGSVTTLLSKPVWDFDDQGATRLPAPLEVAAGETIRVTCTHDATLRDRIPALKGQKPRYVVWGEGTSDEMCLGILSVIR